MSSDERIRNRRSFRNPMLLFGVVMIIFYFSFGIYMLASPGALPGIPVEFLHIFAALLLVYGTYRGWRIYKDYF